MKTANWTFTDIDEKAGRELQAFLPDRIFDSHCHIYRKAQVHQPEPNVFADGPDEVSIGSWRERSAKLIGRDRVRGGMFTPFPVGLHDMDKENDFLVAQLEKNPDCRGLIIVAPQTRRDKVDAYLANPRVIGFKPYHFYSNERPTFDARISSFVPEWMWEAAHERKLVILLHMVRSGALADGANRREIREMCVKYPDVKLILAHAARGFNIWNTINGIAFLAELDNVWFDTAAVCEAGAMTAIVKEFGPKKLLWGTDYPVSETKGRAVTAGDGFAWFDTNNVDWEKFSPGCNPVAVDIESLRAMRETSLNCNLNRADIEDIFYNNAVRLLGIEQGKGTETQELYKHAKERIPGGVQLLSKRPEMFAPGQWPAYFTEARGCEVWDKDGRHYYDMSTHGIGACLLGFRDPDVTEAVQRAVMLGSFSTLNSPDEVALADKLCEVHPWAEQVRFGRCGGGTGAMAIRIARATTDRSVVAICGYHGWHDWYLAANLGEDDALRGHLLPGLNPLGVPRELRGTAYTFTYNNREQLSDIIKKHGDNLAAVVMEPCRNNDPEPGFLEFVRDSAHKAGALLVFDEITIGWRLCHGGSHLKLGVNPDIAFFAKALGNGHPMGAVIGTKKAMEGAHTSFISSTYWTEGVGPAAALVTIDKLKKVKVAEHVARIGGMVKEMWKRNAAKHNIPVKLDDGYPCLAHFAFDHPQQNELKTLYIQLLLERGFLATLSIYPTYSHTDRIVGLYDSAVDEVFAEMAEAIASGDVVKYLKGPVAHTGFRKLFK